MIYERPWQFLNFLPLSHGQGSLRPTPAYGFSETDDAGMLRVFSMMLAAGRPLLSSPTIAFIYGSVWLKNVLYPAHR